MPEIFSAGGKSGRETPSISVEGMHARARHADAVADARRRTSKLEPRACIECRGFLMARCRTDRHRVLVVLSTIALAVLSSSMPRAQSPWERAASNLEMYLSRIVRV